MLHLPISLKIFCHFFFSPFFFILILFRFLFSISLFFHIILLIHYGSIHFFLNHNSQVFKIISFYRSKLKGIPQFFQYYFHSQWLLCHLFGVLYCPSGPLVLKIHRFLAGLHSRRKAVYFYWVPSHVGKRASLHLPSDTLLS